MNTTIANERMVSARNILRNWNQESVYFVPWEWVEEAMIATIRAEHLLGIDFDKGMAQLTRCLEYTKRMPDGLRHKLGV